MKAIFASLVALCAILLALPVVAGDRAQLNVIGYSKDTQYFAFEEYGVADGSGGAYDHLYVVDLAHDTYVAGSPFKIDTDEDEGTGRPLADVRADVLKLAQPTLTKYAISTPAEVWAQVGDGAGKAADAKTLKWSIPNCCEPGSTEDDVFSVTLKTLPMKPTGECASAFDGATFGFALSYVGHGQTAEIHRDQSIPKSRGCPVDYRLYAVLSPFPDEGAGPGGRVAIVAAYPFDFEGPSRRFLAVPID